MPHSHTLASDQVVGGINGSISPLNLSAGHKVHLRWIYPELTLIVDKSNQIEHCRNSLNRDFRHSNSDIVCTGMSKERATDMLERLIYG